MSNTLRDTTHELATKDYVDAQVDAQVVHHDGTLSGNGKASNPLSVPIQHRSEVSTQSTFANSRVSLDEDRGATEDLIVKVIGPESDGNNGHHFIHTGILSATLTDIPAEHGGILKFNRTLNTTNWIGFAVDPHAVNGGSDINGLILHPRIGADNVYEVDWNRPYNTAIPGTTTITIRWIEIYKPAVDHE